MLLSHLDVRECNELKINCLNCGGTYGRGVPVDTSQSIVASEVGIGNALRDSEELGP